MLLVQYACATCDVRLRFVLLVFFILQNARKDGVGRKQLVAFCGRHLQIACDQTMETRMEWHYSRIVCYRQSSKMNGLNGHAILVLLSLISLLTTGAFESLESPADDGNSTANGTSTLDGGLVPMVLTTINQIIAREGNCVLIDCNITGEPFPNVEWFNSHGEQLLDTESRWHLAVDVHYITIAYHSPSSQRHCTLHPNSIQSTVFTYTSSYNLHQGFAHNILYKAVCFMPIVFLQCNQTNQWTCFDKNQWSFSCHIKSTHLCVLNGTFVFAFCQTIETCYDSCFDAWRNTRDYFAHNL